MGCDTLNSMTLDSVQLRVLGALIEKEIVTPETYPLSLNALIAACNQRSSRDPVMELTEEEVRQALHALEDMGLTSVVRDSRVAKYEHRIRTVLNLRRDETAVICLLLLRGPQTPGELRSRADRLYSFDDLEAVQSTLERLARVAAAGEGTAVGRDSPLVVMLPRQPGSREARYAHLLGGPVVGDSGELGLARRNASNDFAGDSSAGAGGGGTMAARVSELEAEVARLRGLVGSMDVRLAELERGGGRDG